MGEEQYRYAAFISYRHEPIGRKWATWLHKSLESYRVPSSLVKTGKAPRRLGRVFRDEEELAASADLSKEIDAALVDSKFLIVVCTPRTPHSRWVNQEIRRFRDLGRGDRILALLVEGEPRESFPPGLVEIRREAVESEAAKANAIDEIEPLAADVREDVRVSSGHGRGHTRGLAKQRILASLLGVRFDDLRNREQRRTQGRILATAVVAVVVAGLFGWLAVYAIGQKTLAGTRLVEVTEQKAEAERQRSEAERRREESEAVIDFINTDVFAGATPVRMPDAKVRDEIVEKMLEPAAKAVREKFKNQPLVEAAVMNQIAGSLLSLGRSAEAEPLLKDALTGRRRVLGETHPETISSINNYAVVLESLGRLAEAEPLYKDALERYRRVRGDDHPDTITSINNYASVLRLLGRSAEAEPLYKDALERSRRVLGEDHPDTLRAINNYAPVLLSLGRSGEAEPLYKDALERRRRVLGEDHPDTIQSFSNYAFVLDSLGWSAEAEPQHKEALERSRRVLGEDHPETIRQMNNYASVLQSLGRSAGAEPLYKDALARSRRVLGEDHPNTITSINNYADVLRSLGRSAEAEPLHRDALQRRRRVLGEDHPDTITSINNYAFVLGSLRASAEAEPVAQRAVRLARASQSLGPRHPYTRAFSRTLARILIANDKPDEARAIAAEFGLPDPTTQPAATQPTPQPPTPPLDDARVAEIRAFVAKLEAEWAEADRAAMTRTPASQPG